MGAYMIGPPRLPGSPGLLRGWSGSHSASVRCCSTPDGFGGREWGWGMLGGTDVQIHSSPRMRPWYRHLLAAVPPGYRRGPLAPLVRSRSCTPPAVPRRRDLARLMMTRMDGTSSDPPPGQRETSPPYPSASSAGAPGAWTRAALGRVHRTSLLRRSGGAVAPKSHPGAHVQRRERLVGYARGLQDNLPLHLHPATPSPALRSPSALPRP